MSVVAADRTRLRSTTSFMNVTRVVYSLKTAVRLRISCLLDQGCVLCAVSERYACSRAVQQNVYTAGTRPLAVQYLRVDPIVFFFFFY